MKRSNQLQKNMKWEIAGISLLALAVLVFLCLINPSMGVVSNCTSMVLKALAGEGRYLFPLAIGTAGFSLLRSNRRKTHSVNVYGYLLLLLTGLTLLHLPIPVDYALQAGMRGDGGGLIGGFSSYIFQKSFGKTGAYIILFTLTIIGILIITDRSLTSIFFTIYKRVNNLIEKSRKQMSDFLYEKEIPDKTVKKEEGPIILNYGNDAEDYFEEQAATIDYQRENEEKDTYLSGSVMVFKNFSQEDDINFEGDESVEYEIKEAGNYRLPPANLLIKPSRLKNGKGEKHINENVRKLEATLESFGVKAKVSKVVRGPAVTRYEIQPPPGVKVSRIMGLADDIALSMAALDVRIEAPVPGRSAVGIEVPNKEISMVYLRELIESNEFSRSPSKLTLALGKDVTGMPVVADLAKMPHLLIAGATGSGKSVCLNTIIASVLFKATPYEVKFLIIDPKMVELTNYNGIAHLVSPVVTDPKKAATSLRWAVKEMEHRYELFARAGVRDIYRYNKLVKEKRRTELPLPLIVVIIDELADLMMVAPADVEDAISRLAQMSRAAGMHLVIATQRPSVDVITGLIKANIPSRISFAVSSQIDSRTILDMGGAEKLLGKGDMLFYPVGVAKPLRVQGAFLSDRDVDNLVSYLKKQSVPDYDECFIAGEFPREEEPVEDELFPEAVRIITESGQASISMLQRRLRIGYARAARLIDIMERKGIVGGYEGSKPRAVLMTMEQYEKNFKNSRR